MEIVHPTSPRNRSPIRIKGGPEVDPVIITQASSLDDFVQRIQNANQPPPLTQTPALSPRAATTQLPSEPSPRSPAVEPISPVRQAEWTFEPARELDRKRKRDSYNVLETSPTPPFKQTPDFSGRPSSPSPKVLRSLEPAYEEESASWEESPTAHVMPAVANRVQSPVTATLPEFSIPVAEHVRTAVADPVFIRQQKPATRELSPREEPIHVRKRRRMRTAPPTQVYVSQAYAVNFDVPDYGSMDQDTRTLAWNKFRVAFAQLFKEHDYLPVVTIRQDTSPAYLRSLYITFTDYTQITHTRNWSDRWKAGLILGLCGIELIGTKFLGLDIGQFAMMTYSSKLMTLYDKPLMSLGKWSGGKLGQDWHPMTQIAAYTGMNLMILIVVRGIASFAGGGGEGIHSMLTFVINLVMGNKAGSSVRISVPQRGLNSPKVTEEKGEPDISLPRATPRANTTYMGMDIGRFSSFATAMASESARASRVTETADFLKRKEDEARGVPPSQRIFEFS
jgi:hypothetical protein